MAAAYTKKKKDDCKSDKEIKFEKKTRLACGGRAMDVDLLAFGPDVIIDTIDLNSVTIDLEDLINPLVKIDVSASIEYEGNSLGIGGFPFVIDLRFILSRICEDGIERELETYDYVREFRTPDGPGGPLNLFVNNIDPISFTFCDCVDSCSANTCTYLVKVLVIEVSFFNIQEAIISDIFINAIAQGESAH